MILEYSNTNVDFDAHVRESVRYHMLHTPYWRKHAERSGLNPETIACLDDLRRFPFVGDGYLRAVRPDELTPTPFKPEELTRSTSSGTTGEPKDVYWGTLLVDQMVDFAAWALSLRGFPRARHWLGTVTDSELLQLFLRSLASRFGAEFHAIDVDAGTAKKVAASTSKEEAMQYFSPVVERLAEVFRTEEVAVYEDIAPLLAMTGARLGELGLGQHLQAILFGGVGMDRAMLGMFKKTLYPNRKFGGWYGDYLGGASMLITDEPDSDELKYYSFAPYVIVQVCKEDNLHELVREGERGVVVMHRIGPDLFIPNRITGDSAIRVRSGIVDWDGVGDVERLPTAHVERLERGFE